jgi:hypothetical protein
MVKVVETKNDILIEPQAWRPRTTKEWHEEFTYRAAILQYEGGFTRAEAEERALRIVGGVSRAEVRKHRDNPRKS